jgi:hypothetical protein
MARPLQYALSFFPFDTGILQDRKVRKLFIKYGSDGFVAYIYLLCVIYSGNGYFCNLEDDLIFDISDYLKIEEELISEIISYCSQIGLFNQDLFGQKILTSTGVQKRFLKIKERTVVRIQKYNLIDYPNSEKEISVPKTKINVAETPIPVTETISHLPETQVDFAETPINIAETNVSETETSVIVTETRIKEAETPINKIKEKIKTNKKEYLSFLEIFNERLNTKFPDEIVSETQFNNLIEKGYKKEDIIKAFENSLNDSFLIENNHLTPEYITRELKFLKYLNYKTLKTREVKVLRYSNLEEAKQQYQIIQEVSKVHEQGFPEGTLVEAAKNRGFNRIILVGDKKYFSRHGNYDRIAE